MSLCWLTWQVSVKEAQAVCHLFNKTEFSEHDLYQRHKLNSLIYISGSTNYYNI